MADALLSVVLQRLATLVETEIQEEVRLLFGGHREVEKLSTSLTAIRAVLSDAEKKQVKDSSVKVWLEQLKAVSYDLDDVLDEWHWHTINRLHGAKVGNLSKKSSSLPRKMVSLSKFWSPCFCFNQTVVHHGIGAKMKQIRERLDLIANEKERYHFDQETRAEEPDQQWETTPLVDVSDVCGRDSDKDSVVSKLCDDGGGDGHVVEESCPVIVSIFGMGGVGKTTLAQLVFNDERVKAHFDYMIWVCVSESFNKKQIAEAIIDAVDKPCSYMYWPLLHTHLQHSIEGKKFLLVLDGVWTDDLRVWEPIKLPLKHGAPGSRILVTTRNERVSMMMEAAYSLSLGQLSPEDSWSVFSRLAFYGKSRENRSNLEPIGRRIAERCNGLPLALKTLGSLMRFKETKQAWQNVLDSKLWELEEVESGIFAPLLLSYYDLSPPMRQCFTYCSIFPKDHKIEKGNLIQHWMAQGFLVSTGSVDMEQKGEEYFDSLVMRSFFQDLERDVEDDSKVTCKMHHIVHDLAQMLAKNECSILEAGRGNNSESDPARTKARHVTLIGHMEEFRSYIHSLGSLRTLQVIHQGDVNTEVIHQRAMSTLRDFFHCLTSLRGLDLSHSKITGLPSEVGKLVHLRLLNLSSLALVELPEAISNLYYMQSLNLDFCRRVERLPRGLGKLINLRHLNIKQTECLRALPSEIGRLTDLRTLDKFIVTEDVEGCNIAELKKLNHLRGHLEITGLEKVASAENAAEAEMIRKEHLQSLDLVFSFGVKEVMENVIEALQPHPNLEVLEVYDYVGSVLPSWITLLTNLKDLRLISCVNCLELPPLGKLPSLETLFVGHFNNVRHVGAKFLGVSPAAENKDVTFIPFPKLKELSFRFMVEWEEWDTTTTTNSAAASTSSCCSGSSKNVSGAASTVIMPNLQKLSFYDCPKLKAIPQHLMPLEELIIIRSPILEQQDQYALAAGLGQFSSS